MRSAVGHLWLKISRIGLKDNEDLIQFRDVILLNRLLILLLLVIVAYIPAEIYFNGYKMLPAVILMVSLALFSLVLHHFRLFRFAHHYLFLVTSGFVMTMGLLVGKTIHNFVMFIPVVLLATLLFKTKAERIISLIVVTGLFLFQNHLFKTVTPLIFIKESIQEVFEVIFFLMSLVITFLIGYYFIQINREYEGIIITQRDKIEIKNRETTDSINYAKRIQTAILPPSEKIQRLLTDNFIFYKPKDIVAGDFYWIEEQGQNILFAVADCTGHGVPGAMVSVVCNNALNRSVNEFKLSQPGDILNKTREIVVQEFQKSGDGVTDGMDISLCCLNITSKILTWSGANNPLWIVRKGELIEFKGEKQPIGQYPKPSEFKTHKVELKTADVLYLFTDGYYDQFGGDKGKKFKASRLKELLISIHSKPINEQHKIVEQTFEKWKNNLEQVDDVCLMGVRVN